jgi:hypothetical protein
VADTTAPRKLDSSYWEMLQPLEAGQVMRSEPELRAAIARLLRAHGIAVEEQVTCAAGTADLVTADHSVIYEVKFRLTRKSLLAACGQIEVYRACINPAARAVIVGLATCETAALIPHLAELGIEVVAWKDVANVEEPSPAIKKASAKGLSAGTVSQHLELRWNVAALARSRGILNPAQLARAIGSDGRQGLYRIWDGSGKNISLRMLARLGCHLGPVDDMAVDFGDWFHYHSGVLRWNIPVVAARVGVVTPVALAFAARVHTNSAYQLWRDQAQFVTLPVLARLAHALSNADYPFDIGTLFAWQGEDAAADAAIPREGLS